MSKKILNMFLFLAALNGGAQAAERTIVIENPTDRGVYMAYSVESADEIISEGYWHALPKDENTLTVTGDGQLSLRLNFDEDTSKPLNLPGTERCGSLTEKFKSIENKTGSPKVILYSGDGDLDGYATKKEGKDCAEAGGVLLTGFHEAVRCSSGVSGEMCFPFSIVDTHPAQSMYVDACNHTEFSGVYLAVRFFEENEWRSAGWYEVKKNQCKKVGPFPTEKAVYAVATTSSYEADYKEWTPDGEKISSCMNPKTGFTYAEKADGTCEAREAIPADAPTYEKITFGQLSEAGFRGVAEFNIHP